MPKQKAALRLIGNVDHNSQNGQVNLAVTLNDETARVSEARARALDSLKQYGEVTKEYSWSATVSMTCTPDDAKRLIGDKYEKKCLEYITDIFVDSHSIVTGYKK